MLFTVHLNISTKMNTFSKLGNKFFARGNYNAKHPKWEQKLQLQTEET